MSAAEVDILWWNINNFYHFDSQKTGDRWPQDKTEYEEKCNRVDAALRAFFALKRKPMVLAFCEITKVAAQDLQNRLLGDYDLISLDAIPEKPSMQIAVFLSKTCRCSLTEKKPIVVDDMPRNTRPMAVIDVEKDDATVRLIFCHWQARFEDEAQLLRGAMADYLGKYSYNYLNEDKTKNRSILIVGDLNEEPFEKAMEYMNAHRHRARAGEKHWSNDDRRRVHLYNCTWRLLGEKNAYLRGMPNSLGNSAGTFYYKLKKSWHSYDQLIVSQGLISKGFPHLDENDTHIVNLPEFLPDHLPLSFQKRGARYIGLSDHLPVYTNIFFKG